MPEPQGIALSLSNRRAVLKDDPEYNRLLLALRDEQPEALQDDEIAHLQTLSAPNFRTQNDPVADRARLGVSDDAPYTSTMGRTLLGGTGAKMSAAPPLSKWDEFTGTLGELLHASTGTARGDLVPLLDFTMKPANKKLEAIKQDILSRLPEDTGDRSTFFTRPSVTDPSPMQTRIRNEAGHIVRAATDTARLAAGFVPDTNLDVATFGTAKILGAGLAGAKMLGAAVPFLGTLGDVTKVLEAEPNFYKAAKTVKAVKTAQRLKDAVEPFVGALDKTSRKAMAQEVTAIFPHLDSYSTLSPHLTAALILKKVDALSPDAQAAVRAIAAVMPPGERIAPKQLQALVARKAYTPDRIVVRHKTTLAQHQTRGKEYMGAPWHVHTPQLQASSDQQYLEQVLDGLEGADWYDDSGREVMFRTGDNPVRARQTSDAVAITSPQTDVNVNTAFAVQANNQRAMGRPIRTGRYPSVMGPKIETAYAAEGAETLGPKRGPFADNIAIGGDFFDADRPIRGVHDIWDGEARGFANPDGTPLRRGFTAPEHRWMDAQDARLVAFANNTKIGGRTDWTVGRLQAAAWTGSKKRAGDILPGEPVANIATAFRRPNLQAQGSREVASPIHFPELNEPSNRPELDRYSRLVREKSGVYDPEGRDRLALEMGGLVGETSEGPGMFKNEPALGYQTDISATTQPAAGPSLAGINLESLQLPRKQYDKLAKLIAEGKTLDQALNGKFGREMEISAQELLTVTESAYALLFGQAAGAGSMMGAMPTEAALRAWRVAATSKYDVPILGAEVLLGATPTNAQMSDAMRVFTQAGATPDSIAPVFVPGRGIRFGNLADSTLSNDQFKKAVNDVAKLLGGSKTKGRFSSIYVSNDWEDTQRYGEAYLGNLLPHAEKLDPLLKEISGTMLTDVDPYMTRTTSVAPITPSRRLTLIREVLSSGEGLQALEALAKQNGLPLLGLLALLGVTPPSSTDETGADTSGSHDNAAEGANPAYTGSMRSLLAR